MTSFVASGESGVFCYIMLLELWNSFHFLFSRWSLTFCRFKWFQCYLIKHGGYHYWCMCPIFCMFFLSCSFLPFVVFSWKGPYLVTLDELQKNSVKMTIAWVGIVLYKRCKFIHEKVRWIIILAGRHDSKQISNTLKHILSVTTFKC